MRVVLDSALRLPVGSRLVQSARDTPLLVIAGDEAPPALESALRGHGVDVARTTGTTAQLDPTAVLKHLAARGITRLMVEGGPTLAAAMITADLVDEAVLFHSGVVIGGDGVDALEPQILATLGRQLTRAASEPLGSDRQDGYERG